MITRGLQPTSYDCGPQYYGPVTGLFMMLALLAGV